MWLREVIRSEKRDIQLGQWKTGPVPHRQFPLSRGARPYRPGGGVQWRLVAFTAGGNGYRLLIMIHEGKQIFKAMLGELAGRGLKILCSYEYHAGEEPGWHCHAVCGDPQAVPVGVQRGPWIRRVPAAHDRHRRLAFDVSQAEALARAAQVFRLRVQLQGELL